MRNGRCLKEIWRWNGASKRSGMKWIFEMFVSLVHSSQKENSERCTEMFALSIAGAFLSIIARMLLQRHVSHTCVQRSPLSNTFELRQRKV